MTNPNEVIEDTVKALNDAWNAKKPKSFASVFTEDAIFTNVLGDVAEGRKAIEEMHVYPFQNPLKDAFLEYSIQHIKWIHDDAAIVDFRWVSYNQKVPNTEQVLPQRNGLLNMVVILNGNKGEIKAGYNTDYTATYQRNGDQEDDIITKG
ncbi:SgcJ/EcaC family oxidoreductase [Pontibacillus sp. ALD_SL1]|uniref:SgcJ/EcaC family oxidoreductase n=1 Tax=Pontibacillus sp. ALD_SL1 TaxID=2777185 RepID=UPI001A9756C3|nr:SgcJ/EcaC family oxidoreductase [Pontibacillus sp. ALD_SL1]QSS99503.1 SgcJ/EcaC family oxidoreductase [Pontibacillus sp. ALD_SL1]